MAAVKDEIRSRIERYSAYLIAEWENIPQLAEEWADWDADDRLDFVIEWPIREDRLDQLREYAAQGIMTPAQYEQYERLLKLVQRHRPTLEQLFAD